MSKASPVPFKLGFAPLLALVSGCAGPSAETKKSLNQLLVSGRYAEAEAQLRAAKDSDYGVSNAVLYDLDLAMVEHDAGKCAKSSEHFARAEARMQELYTQSLSRGAGAMLANENVEEYRGADFERALAHLFHALNYVCLDKPDEALVEARQVELLLEDVNRRAGRRSYGDDAFAHLLASLLYEDAGKLDDARISREAALAAYRRYAELYSTPSPPAAPPLAAGEGELVVFHYNGVGPRKVEHQTDFLESIQNIAYPEFVQDPYAIASAVVAVGTRTATAELVEDVTAIATKDLSERVAAHKGRSQVRAAIKLLGTVTGVDATQSEFSDKRSWTSVPAQIRMARLALPAGEYDVEVLFVDSSGRSVATKVLPAVRIAAGRRAYRHVRTAR